MKLLKRTNKVKDERIEHVRNTIYKEMHYVIMAICIVSISFNMYQYGVDKNAFMKESIIELLVLMVGGGYYLVRSMHLGVFWDEVEMHDRTSKTPMSKKNIYTSIILALVIAVIMGINSAVSYADSTSQGLWYFLLVLLTSLLIYLPILLGLFVGTYFLAKKISWGNREE